MKTLIFSTIAAASIFLTGSAFAVSPNPVLQGQVGQCLTHVNAGSCNQDPGCSWAKNLMGSGDVCLPGHLPPGSECYAHKNSGSCKSDEVNSCGWIPVSGTKHNGICIAIPPDVSGVINHPNNRE